MLEQAMQTLKNQSLVYNDMEDEFITYFLMMFLISVRLFQSTLSIYTKFRSRATPLRTELDMHIQQYNHQSCESTTNSG